MRTLRCLPMLWMLCVSGLGLVLAGGASAEKIPITTTSDAARQLYVQGRELQENLRLTDARQLYLDAIAKDGDFALAHLAKANTSTTANEFFAALERAVELAPNVSEGERLMILGVEAGIRRNPDRQEEIYTRLVQLHPDDERALTLLGGLYFGRLDYQRAISHYEKATAIAPDFSPPYNNLGYSYRFIEDYARAEQAFKKYVELLPDEPNPYDSYAEFLMKVGRFEESIENYQRALEINSQFMPSFVGIGNNYTFLGQTEQALETYDKMSAVTRTVAEDRQVLFQSAVTHVHAGEHEEALALVRRMYDIAAESDDFPTMSGDLNTMGNILLEAGMLDKALAMFDRSVGVAHRADTPDEVKEAARRNHLFDAGRVLLAQGKLEAARQLAVDYERQAATRNVPFEMRRAHRLIAMIALEEKDYPVAVTHLGYGSDQNPRVLYLKALAYYGQGNDTLGRRYCEKAANFNGLGMNYAYVRTKAQKLLGEGNAATLH